MNSTSLTLWFTSTRKWTEPAEKKRRRSCISSTQRRLIIHRYLDFWRVDPGNSKSLRTDHFLHLLSLLSTVCFIFLYLQTVSLCFFTHVAGIYYCPSVYQCLNTRHTWDSLAASGVQISVPRKNNLIGPACITCPPSPNQFWSGIIRCKGDSHEPTTGLRN